MRKYLVFETIGNYTLLIRLDKEGNPIEFDPVVAAYNYNPDTEDWIQGHYFPSIRMAIEFMLKENGETL